MAGKHESYHVHFCLQGWHKRDAKPKGSHGVFPVILFSKKRNGYEHYSLTWTAQTSLQGKDAKDYKLHSYIVHVKRKSSVGYFYHQTPLMSWENGFAYLQSHPYFLPTSNWHRYQYTVFVNLCHRVQLWKYYQEEPPWMADEKTWDFCN